MQSFRLLPVVLALGLFAGCNKSDVDAAEKGAKSSGDAAKGAAQQAGTTLDSLLKDLELTNLSKLDTVKLQQLGKDAMTAIATQLNTIKDLPTAKSVSSAVMPVVDKLETLKISLGNKLPNTEVVKNAITALTTKFPSGEIMDAIKPMLTELQTLIS